MTAYSASLAAVLGLAAEEVEMVEETETGWRAAVCCPRPATCPACAARGDVALAQWPARTVVPTRVGETLVQVAWTPRLCRCVAGHHVTRPGRSRSPRGSAGAQPHRRPR